MSFVSLVACMFTNSLAKSIFFLFILVGALCSPLVTNAQHIEGAWIGYALDLQQLKSDNLPKLYTIKMVIQKKDENNYQGVLSRYWEKYFNSISGFSAVLNPAANMLSLTERGQFKTSLAWNDEFSKCKILSSLSIVKEQNKIILEGKYYGVSSNSVDSDCPSGKIHLERPTKDSSSFAFLNDFLRSKTSQDLAKATVIKKEPAAKDSVLPSLSTKPPEDILSYFPEIIVSTSPYANLERSLNYDVYQLAKSQKNKRTERAIISNHQKLSLILTSPKSDGDTLNLMFDGIKIASNHKLSSFAPITIDIDLKDLPPSDDVGYVYSLSVVPFSWRRKTIKLNIAVLSSSGEEQMSIPYSFSSDENLQIPLIIQLAPKK